MIAIIVTVAKKAKPSLDRLADLFFDNDGYESYI